MALENRISGSVIGRELKGKESVNYPPAGNGGAGGTSEIFDYDTAGRPWHFTTRGGNIQTLTYDALHRQKGFSWDDGGITPGVTFGYDIASRLTSIANANATITRTYFDDNLLASEAAIGGPASAVNYRYDADGNRDLLVYPNNAFSFAYTYTGLNQLKSIRNTAVSSPTATYGYNVNGSLISRALNNSTSSSYGYDALGRVEDISHFLTGETRTFGYDYDSVGRRKWAQRDNARGDVFGYDLNDEVTATKLNITSPATTGPGTPTISYDANGNRATFAAYGATDTYATNNLSQYTSRNGVNATYGPKGNLGSFGAGTSYIYDAQNRLTSATDGGNTFTFKYDGLNRQVSRKLNAGAPVYSVWDGWELLEEVQNNIVTAAYLSGATGLIKDLISNNYYYQDGSGSTSHLADNNGTLLEWYRYDLQGTPIVYGPANVLRTGGSSYAIRQLFTGQQWIKELGLYDLRNRFYSPDLGRFLQPDPIGFGGDPSNLYRYCGGDPVNRTDPSGLGSATPPSHPFVPKKPEVAGVDSIDYGNSNLGGGMQGISTQGWWSGPSGIPTGGGGGGRAGGGGGGGGTTVITGQRDVSTTETVAVEGWYYTVPTSTPDLGSPFFGFQPGQISFGFNSTINWTPLRSAIPAGNGFTNWRDAATTVINSYGHSYTQEQAGTIFQNSNGTFGYTDPRDYRNTERGSFAGDAPAGTDLFGKWHLHPGGYPFGGGDISRLNSLNTSGFLGLPNGTIYMYDPAWGTPAIIELQSPRR